MERFTSIPLDEIVPIRDAILPGRHGKVAENKTRRGTVDVTDA